MDTCSYELCDCPLDHVVEYHPSPEPRFVRVGGFTPGSFLAEGVHYVPVEDLV